MNLTEWTTAQKAVTGTFALVVGISMAFGFMYATFETLKASEMKWDQHSQIMICRTVGQANVKIATLKAQIEYGQLSPADKKIKEAELEAEKQIIKDLDPKHKCKQT